MLLLSGNFEENSSSMLLCNQVALKINNIWGENYLDK